MIREAWKAWKRGAMACVLLVAGGLVSFFLANLLVWPAAEWLFGRLETDAANVMKVVWVIAALILPFFANIAVDQAAARSNNA